MKVDTMLAVAPGEVAKAAADAEGQGFGGIWFPEIKHDPFLSVAVAAGATERIELATGIAVAFARTPMVTAVQANDLQALSGGRLVLGLGSQIKAHITRRYDMPWSKPAARMREYVLAMRAIWSAWADGERLDFRGEFYTCTLMPPMFVPEPHGFGPPDVVVAGVGPLMTEAAGEVADGLLAHSFTTGTYLREVTLPALRTGAARRSATAATPSVVGAPFVALGLDAAERDAALATLRHQLAFYASTPAYRPVLELHGWEQLGDRLHTLSRAGEWAAMAAELDDDVVDAFVVTGTPAEAAARIRERFGGVLDRISPVVPDVTDPARVAELAAAMRKASEPSGATVERTP